MVVHRLAQQWGGRDATLAEQVIFAEEYARAGVPGRVNHIGIELAGPTILTFGTEEQKRRRRGLISLSRSGQFRGVTPRLLPQLIHPSRQDTPLAAEVMETLQKAPA